MKPNESITTQANRLWWKTYAIACAAAPDGLSHNEVHVYATDRADKTREEFVAQNGSER